MANIKSQIKRAKTNEKRRHRNVAYKSALKTAMKEVTLAVEAKDKERATVAYNTVSKKLDQSISKGFHHKNYVARQKSRLAKAVNSI